MFVIGLPSLAVHIGNNDGVSYKLQQKEYQMIRRQCLYVFLFMVSMIFVGSTMPVMAKSNSDTERMTSSSKISKSSKSSKSTKSGKSGKSKKTSAEKKVVKKKKANTSGEKMARVNINTATAAELTEIAGIGPKTAKKIVAYRKKHGKFKKADDLLNIKGIGEKTLNKMKSQLTF